MDAVADVLRDQAERAERSKASHRPPPDRTPVFWAVAALCTAATIWVTVSPPGLLRPPPAPPPPPRLMEAELRMTVVQAVLRLEAFLDSAGALPLELVTAFEGPEDVEGLHYERLAPDRFRLSAVRGDAVLLFESGDSIGPWIAEARGVMEGRSP